MVSHSRYQVVKRKAGGEKILVVSLFSGSCVLLMARLMAAGRTGKGLSVGNSPFFVGLSVGSCQESYVFLCKDITFFRIVQEESPLFFSRGVFRTGEGERKERKVEGGRHAQDGVLIPTE